MGGLRVNREIVSREKALYPEFICERIQKKDGSVYLEKTSRQ